MFYWAFERVFVILQTKSSLLQQLEVLGGEEQKEREQKRGRKMKKRGRERERKSCVGHRQRERERGERTK